MSKINNLKGKEHKLTIEDKRKGGKNSVASRRERKAFRDMAEDFLAMPINPDNIEEVSQYAHKLGYNTEGWTAGHYGLFAQGLKMLKGDLAAFETMLNLVGEKPADKQQLTVAELPSITLKKK